MSVPSLRRRVLCHLATIEPRNVHRRREVQTDGGRTRYALSRRYDSAHREILVLLAAADRRRGFAAISERPDCGDFAGDCDGVAAHGRHPGAVCGEGQREGRGLCDLRTPGRSAPHSERAQRTERDGGAGVGDQGYRGCRLPLPVLQRAWRAWWRNAGRRMCRSVSSARSAKN